MEKSNSENLSPCVGICQYNKEDLCSGCFRTSKEITQWVDMTLAEKKKVINLLPSRMEELF
jgi:predicted Fe-S protein YdhL (DUF1289 family)|tara:strand:+ start:1029 stop:1211 length:183 start_codon:yes stop_codon:yes gene_type:complete